MIPVIPVIRDEMNVVQWYVCPFGCGHRSKKLVWMKRHMKTCDRRPEDPGRQVGLDP